MGKRAPLEGEQRRGRRSGNDARRARPPASPPHVPPQPRAHPPPPPPPRCRAKRTRREHRAPRPPLHRRRCCRRRPWMWLRRGAQADPPESLLREDGPPGPAPWPSSHACDPPPTGASWSATTGSIALPRGDPPVHCGSQIEQSHQPRSVPFRRSCRATHGKVGGTHPRRRRRRWARRTGNPAEFKSGGGRFAGGEMQYSCFGVGKKQGVLAAAHRTSIPAVEKGVCVF